jgi:hypothetical protein
MQGASSEDRSNENPTQVGDSTNQSTENKPVDKESASKLANMLRGLDFPADKAKILSYITRESSGETSNDDIMQKLQSNLTDNKQFSNVYEVEKEAGLVTQEK